MAAVGLLCPCQDSLRSNGCCETIVSLPGLIEKQWLLWDYSCPLALSWSDKVLYGGLLVKGLGQTKSISCCQDLRSLQVEQVIQKKKKKTRKQFNQMDSGQTKIKKTTKRKAV